MRHIFLSMHVVLLTLTSNTIHCWEETEVEAFVKNVSFHHDAKEEEKIVGFFVIVRKKK